MFTGMVMGMTGLITVLAFLPRERDKMNPLLHFVALMLWIVAGYTMFNNIPPTGNTYLPTAIFIVCVAMVIVHLITVINIFLGRRKAPLSYDEDKKATRDRIFASWRNMPNNKNGKYWK